MGRGRLPLWSRPRPMQYGTKNVHLSHAICPPFSTLRIRVGAISLTTGPEARDGKRQPPVGAMTACHFNGAAQLLG